MHPNNTVNSIVKTISEIIKFDSSKYPPLPNMPFGKGAADCLNYFLSLASSMGFETKNYDNYVGEVIFGEGEEFAILAHLDVVPAGNNWTHEPFGGEIDHKNMRIWGRGAMDDKGPAVIVLYCLKDLKDSGFVPKRKIKLIVGCNEESGWECIAHYNKCTLMPNTGFSPDADFPVIYAEKGILSVKLAFPPIPNVKRIKGGERSNMVCDRCEVEFVQEVQGYEKFNLTCENDRLVSKGKSAHGSTPHLGVNAIENVLKFLNLSKMHTYLFGDAFNLKKLQDETGALTLSPNIIEGDQNGVKVTCDIRYPSTYKREHILKHIEDEGISYEVIHYQPPLYNDKECNLIKTLCSVYNEVTGKNLSPIAIGGGTYARALKCGVAFGPEEEGEESTIHKPDEYITFEKIIKCLQIYTLAIKRLCF